MNTERQKVLDMLSAGQINAEEAARLLECLETDAKQSAPQPRRVDPGNLRGKKLRVQANGHDEEGQKMDINVSIPLVLARYVDDIIANCLPESVNRELAAEGINLRKLNISQIVESLEGLDEDIVNADIAHEGMDIKVRVYVD